MIYNDDGSLYSVSSSLQVFDPNNTQERDLLNQLDAEVIMTIGVPILLYEILIDQNTIDPMYHEARGALFNQTPVTLYAYYDPISSQNYQNMFGIDAPDMITFELNYDATVQAIGHLPLIGSRLYSVHRGENWEIIQRSSADWKLWGQIRLILECKRFQESLSRGEGKITQPQNSYKIN